MSSTSEELQRHIAADRVWLCRDGMRVFDAFHRQGVAAWRPETLDDLEGLTDDQLYLWRERQIARAGALQSLAAQDALEATGLGPEGQPYVPVYTRPMPAEEAPTRAGWVEEARAVPVPHLVSALALERKGSRYRCPCCRQGGRGTVTVAKSAWHCHHCKAGGDGLHLVAAVLTGSTDTRAAWEQVGRWFSERR